MRVSLTVVCLLIAASAFAANPPAAKLTCVLLTKEGKVEVAPKSTADWKICQTNQVLQIGDRLRTGLRSRATLQWSDLSVLRVKELTSLEIQPPAQDGQKPQLDLKSGAAYFFNREKPSEVQFRTPVASGAIRGTEFHLAVAENGRTTLTLLDGEVALSNPAGSVTIQSGEQAVVEPGKAPGKTAVLDAINIIQWALYYPAVLDSGELGLSEAEQRAFSDALAADRSGDLVGAMNRYPENRQPASDAEKIFRAAQLLSVGQVEQTEAVLNSVSATSPFVLALREVIAAVKHQSFTPQSEPTTASAWMARSYYLQSRSQLEPARNAAREATRKSPNFGAAWIRLAELEFSFGHSAEALAALNKGLEISPRNAQGVALKGFLLSSQNKSAEALRAFEQAVALDGALGNAWLGRGLVKIRQGNARAGRADLQVAATLEPQRSILRSYLGKAFSHTRDTAHAGKELALAQKLDPNDPTPWLYSALLDQQGNRINEAVADLKKSQELNDNRSVFRSRLLLDQDKAVRGANLAAIYRDAGMFDVSVREAARAVNYDYASYSSHQFLANSYDALRDPKLINLRYETPWFSELLVANLLAPVGGGSLSQNISQQEYSRFFEGDHFGVLSGTEYFSSGDWIQYGSLYGNCANMSYSLDTYYRTENGQRPNNDLEQLALSAKVKYQLTPKDSVFFQVSYFDAESGDLAQYYNQASASQTVRVTEKQRPNLLAGYHREWAPGSHTLFLATRFDDTLTLNDPAPAIFFLRTRNVLAGMDTRLLNPPVSLQYQRDLEAYSAELQHIFQTPKHTLVFGGRFQAAQTDTASDLQSFGFPVTSQKLDADLDRESVYGYEQWQILEKLRLTAGLSYDRLHFPKNVDTSPITSEESTVDRLSPKVGLLWTPCQNTHLRAAYTRSLGGAFLDASVRLEPAQVAGFNQAFRSLIPESVAGLVPGTKFETWGAGVDHTFKGTYFAAEGEILKSTATRSFGILTNSDLDFPAPDSASSTRQSLDFKEQSLFLTVNQLLDKEFSLGARYRLTHAELETRSLDISPTVTGAGALNQDVTAILHQVNLYAIYNHRCGFFAQFNSVWSQQSNRHYAPDIPGDNFWQHNIYAGYRFLRRQAEVRVGLLNLTDDDYRLNPLTLYNELPRERTFVGSFKFYF